MSLISLRDYGPLDPVRTASETTENRLDVGRSASETTEHKLEPAPSPTPPGPGRLSALETAPRAVDQVQESPRQTDQAVEPAAEETRAPEAPSTDDLGRCLTGALGSRFEVLGPIAIGGMAVLFQLRHTLTGGLFVAKILRPEFLQEPALREAFTREARIGAHLACHPNAVAILDLAEAEDPGGVKAHGGTPFLLMPYIDGEDLDQVLAARGRLEREEAFMLLAQMASLLMFAESQGIVHADIALGNIRLDRFGQYRLLDYGLARGPGEVLDTLQARAGTPAYNSPEQLRGEPLDIRSDLYSLGLVFFHAVTGRPAFATDDVQELARAHLSGAWEIPPELALDPALSALLKALLATGRESRMSSAFELSGAMTALGYELPSFLRSLPGSSPTPRLRRRRLEASEE